MWTELNLTGMPPQQAQWFASYYAGENPGVSTLYLNPDLGTVTFPATHTRWFFASDAFPLSAPLLTFSGHVLAPVPLNPGDVRQSASSRVRYCAARIYPGVCNGQNRGVRIREDTNEFVTWEMSVLLDDQGLVAFKGHLLPCYYWAGQEQGPEASHVA